MQPKVRFKEFSDDWEQRKLLDIVDVLDGDRGKNYPKEKDFRDTGHTLFLNASNVTKEGFLFEDTQYISEEKSNVMGSGKLQLDDIVVTSRGSLGHLAWYNTEIKAIVPYARINSGMLILRKKSDISLAYLYQFMKSHKGQNQIFFMSFGSAQPQLTKKGVENLDVSLPLKIEEQQKIGDFFNSLDNLITLHQRKFETLKKLKKGFSQKMFPKNGCKVPDKNLEKWCTLERAQNNKIYPKGTIYTPLSASDGIAHQLQEDDYISDRYAIFIPKTKYINVFYEIFCKSFEPFYQKYNQGINFAFDNFKFFDFAEITLSDKELQEMEEALKEINNLIDNERLFIQQMKGFKDFCLDKMFC